MRKHLEQALNHYCSSELDSFKKSSYFNNILDLASQMGFSVECSFGYGKADEKNIYLGFSVVDNDGMPVWVGDTNDRDFLGYSVSIIQYDKKERFKFFSWEEDNDFIDTIKWVLQKLYEKLNRR